MTSDELRAIVDDATRVVINMTDQERLRAANDGVLDRMFLRPEVIAYWRDRLA